MSPEIRIELKTSKKGNDEMNKNREVHYRPEIAEILKEALTLANVLYKLNFQQAYYMLLSKIEKDPERAEALVKTSECFVKDACHGVEFFEEYYEKQYNIEYISAARAAYVIFGVYKDAFDTIKEKIDRTGLTGMEEFMVDSFFNKLTAPTRNPNIEIKDGHTECYYDRNHASEFHHDLKSSLEYINEECQITIEIFSTPD